MESVESKNKTRFWVSCVKGALVSVAVSLVCILVFAFVIKLFGIGDGFIKPFNQVIKAVSVFAGVWVTLKKTREKGLLSGVLIGLFYTAIAFIVFSVLNGGFSFDATLVNDVIFGGITGAICGVLCVNVKR